MSGGSGASGGAPDMTETNEKLGQLSRATMENKPPDAQEIASMVLKAIYVD
jgi:hypothetical protein